MTKAFCDLCENELTKDEGYAYRLPFESEGSEWYATVQIYTKESNGIPMMLCDGCTRNMLRKAIKANTPEGSAL